MKKGETYLQVLRSTHAHRGTPVLEPPRIWNFPCVSLHGQVDPWNKPRFLTTHAHTAEAAPPPKKQRERLLSPPNLHLVSRQGSNTSKRTLSYGPLLHSITSMGCGGSKESDRTAAGARDVKEKYHEQAEDAASMLSGGLPQQQLCSTSACMLRRGSNFFSLLPLVQLLICCFLVCRRGRFGRIRVVSP